MLTKNLLRSKAVKDSIRPQFLRLGDEDTLALSAQLVGVFEHAVGKTRAELEDEVQLIFNDASPQAVVGRGLEKLLFDRAEFSEFGQERVEMRDQVLSHASALFARGDACSAEEFQCAVAENFSLPSATLCAGLYSDLPMYQTVTRVKETTPEALIHRYNCAQVQGLLLACESLKVRIPAKNLLDVRRLFKYIRFQNLLARVQRLASGHFEICIDGPMSLFYQTQKYGMSLANFFPAVLLAKEWTLEAVVQAGPGKTRTLTLDETCGIRSHYSHFNAYVPEEVKLLQSAFEKKVSAWTVRAAEDFLAFEGDQYCFPDFCFENGKGEKAFLEVFHAWHAAPLTARLAQLEHPGNARAHPLLLGVARALLKDEKIAAALEANPYFKSFGFLFREMPTVDMILGVLSKVSP